MKVILTRSFQFFVSKMSQARLAPCLQLPLENKTLVNVIEKAKDWALMHGVGMRDKKHFNKDVIQVCIHLNLNLLIYDFESLISMLEYEWTYTSSRSRY